MGLFGHWTLGPLHASRAYAESLPKGARTAGVCGSVHLANLTGARLSGEDGPINWQDKRESGLTTQLAGLT